MKRTIGLCVLGAIVLLVISVARAETAADLLEKGIYTEETVGDLDAAMKIYKKIVADERANRVFAAKAQYRLAMCLLKQGKKEEAKKNFEDLVKRFPDQKELVAKAKKHLETQLKLTPAPWKDGEVLQMTLKMGEKTLGNYLFCAKTTQYNGKKVWQLQYWQRMGGIGYSGVSRIWVDLESLRPIHSLVDNKAFGRFDADYGPTEVTIRSTIRDKQSVKQRAVEGVVYDNEEGYWVFRCLPLEVGYYVNLPIFVTFTTGQIALPVNVTAKEQIKVAAGQFECYKLDLGLVNQTFWVSADEHHYLVKFEAGAVYAELVSVDPKDINQYASKKWQCSIEAPEGWFFLKSTAGASSKDKLMLDILDPDALTLTTLEVWPLDQDKSDKDRTIRTLAEGLLPGLSKRLTDFEVRPDSWNEQTVRGRPAIRFLADFVVSGRKKAGYATCVLGESTWASVFVQIDPDKLDDFRKQIDPVIDTLKVK